MEVVDVAPVPAANRALRQAGLGIQDDAFLVKILFHTQAVAAAAGAGGVVEGEQARLQFIDAVAALRAGETSGKTDILVIAVHVTDRCQAVGQAEGGFKGFRQADAQVLAHLEAVDHHFDAMLLLFVQHRGIVEVDDDAVDPGADEAAGPQFLEYVQVFALAIAHHRRQQHESGVLRQGQDRVHHLADGLGLQVDGRGQDSAVRRRGHTAGAGSRRFR